MQCPNCGCEYYPNTQRCSQCGAILYAIQDELLITNSSSGDTLLGFALGFFLVLCAGLGIILDPILYFMYRGSRRSFARGILWGMLIPTLGLVCLILGALVLCFAPALLSSHSK